MSRRAHALTRAAELVATYGLPAFLLTLPLEFTAMLFGQQLSRFVLLLVAVAYVYLLVARRRTLSVPRFLSVLLLVVLTLASLASWLFTRAPHSTNQLLGIALYPIVGLLLTNLPVSERDHHRAWAAFMVSGALVAVLGFVLYVGHLHIWSPNPAVANRLNITFADPNITARFLTLAACVAVLMFSARKAPVWLSIATAICCAVVLPMTWSRSGIALFVVCVALMVAFALDRRRALAIAAVALVAFGLSTTVNPDTRDRAMAAAATAYTALSGQAVEGYTAPASDPGGIALSDNRVYLVSAGLKMFSDHPLLGVGFGGYQNAMLTTYRYFLPQGYTDSVSHTSVITVLAEQGLIGLALLLLFLVQLAREAYASRRRDQGDWLFWTTVPAALILPIFLFSQFEARFLQEPYFWVALGMYYSARMLAQRDAALAPTASTARARAERAA